MKNEIVFTTINIPHILRDIFENLQTYEHLEDTGVIVVGDKKTPTETWDIVHTWKIRGLKVLYMDVESQIDWLQGKLSKIGSLIPWNSDNRRNVGYLKAAELGAERIISIDDDNFPLLHTDFIEGHSIVGTTMPVPRYTSANNWINPLDLFAPKCEVYPRGFPYSKRVSNSLVPDISDSKDILIVVNEGLWIQDPDVDAITRMKHPWVIGDEERLLQEKIQLAPYMTAPLNSQNTCFHISTLPCFYFIPMDLNYGGFKVDRYGDIWMGYFALRVIDELKEGVTYGTPIVRHMRNQHNPIKDLTEEFGGILLSEYLIDALEEATLEGNFYSDLYLSLGRKVADWARNSYLPQEAVYYFQELPERMEVWVDACTRVIAKRVLGEGYK